MLTWAGTSRDLIQMSSLGLLGTRMGYSSFIADSKVGSKLPDKTVIVNAHGS